MNSPSNKCLPSRIQDSYALCRVFKKNGMSSEFETSNFSLLDYMQGAHNEHHETMSPGFPLASSSINNLCNEEEEEEHKDDKDESWMQFITDDVWCSSSSKNFVGDEVSKQVFTN
ncbi:NAC domain containing protein 57 [Striga hermonthica]|uniref:NAC domain containing protein 57 n=1 Tax=Striga hermonthica TaxID=68872 RepID=A0A9N7N091_STRHE|nr:NAC domain containing protein 57 [Striga hermonthica]